MERGSFAGLVCRNKACVTGFHTLQTYFGVIFVNVVGPSFRRQKGHLVAPIVCTAKLGGCLKGSARSGTQRATEKMLFVQELVFNYHECRLQTRSQFDSGGDGLPRRHSPFGQTRAPRNRHRDK